MRKRSGAENMAFPAVSVAAAVAVAVVVSGCAAGAWRWRSEMGRTHPLVGHIYDVAANAYLSESQLFDRLAQVRFVLLGEQHDNPDHHGLQARALRALVARGRAPAVVMEMLDVDDSDALAACQGWRPCSPRELAEAVAWDESGWPEWRIYEPVLAVALRSGLPISPGSLNPEMMRAYARGEALDDGQDGLHRLGLDEPLAPDVRAAMAAEIRESHCGHAPEEMLDGMVAAQRLRDAHLAESLRMAAPLGRAVLIAGFGHVRTDRAVPYYLAHDTREDGVLAVALLEVDDEVVNPAAYAAAFDTERLPFDFVWFTPRTSDAEACEQFRGQLRKLGRPQ